MSPLAILTESIERGKQSEEELDREIFALIADGVPFNEWTLEEQQVFMYSLLREANDT